jgi:hypothetical protein
LAYYRITFDFKFELFGLIQESSSLLTQQILKDPEEFWHRSETIVDFSNSKNLEYQFAQTLKSFIEELSKSEHPDYLQEYHNDFLKIWNKKKIQILN